MWYFGGLYSWYERRLPGGTQVSVLAVKALEGLNHRCSDWHVFLAFQTTLPRCSLPFPPNSKAAVPDSTILGRMSMNIMVSASKTRQQCFLQWEIHTTFIVTSEKTHILKLIKWVSIILIKLFQGTIITQTHCI